LKFPLRARFELHKYYTPIARHVNEIPGNNQKKRGKSLHHIPSPYNYFTSWVLDKVHAKKLGYDHRQYTRNPDDPGGWSESFGEIGGADQSGLDATVGNKPESSLHSHYHSSDIYILLSNKEDMLMKH